MSYKCVAVSLGCYEHGYINIWSWYTITRVLDTSNSFHPYGVNKSSTNQLGWGEGGAVTSVGWQITLCDPIDKWRPVVLRWISLRTIRSFIQTSSQHTVGKERHGDVRTQKKTDNMLSRFHLILERHRQRVGQICYIKIVRQCADAR